MCMLVMRACVSGVVHVPVPVCTPYVCVCVYCCDKTPHFSLSVGTAGEKTTEHARVPSLPPSGQFVVSRDHIGERR
jgi:hypothetical protein